jgi:hypothetical protein
MADEIGHWHGLGVLVAVDKKAIKLEDRANHIVSITEFDGAVYNGDGKAFLDKARYQVVGLVDIGVGATGYKTFSDADGSKVFGKYTVTESKPPVSDKAASDELEGEYKIPTPVLAANPVTGTPSK